MRGDTSFRKPNSAERLFNKIFGRLVGLGIAPPDYYLLEVVGRKSGRSYSTPVNVVEVKGKRFLVAPRGYTQWVRNAQVAGRVTLRKGSRREEFHLRPVPTEEKPEVLKVYLDRFRIAVQRYFPVSAGSSPTPFQPFVVRYPVFELLPSNPAPGQAGSRIDQLSTGGRKA